MSQITIRELPPVLESQLRRMATEKGVSLNKTVQALLMSSLGLVSGTDKKRNLSELSGTWSPDEALAFEKNMKIFDHIDTEIWD